MKLDRKPRKKTRNVEKGLLLGMETCGMEVEKWVKGKIHKGRRCEKYNKTFLNFCLKKKINKKFYTLKSKLF